ncbi:uncharacterized protein N7498_005457 [Penicillium cinerascens]|uniref:Uncharacterized protein n=1 Tax=Penicillium cinerascens TaxID=70096 RepID=A0A9W9MNK8_9EURO|nr:uncharacterized protein N7498_005457 [Penicillium cinerascens]KAJ5204578.1 hypothetical protein N7498_005457 [Penicillium cinerascens]
MSGITDEAAIEGHDLIHDAELEEERLHENDNDHQKAQQSKADLGAGEKNLADGTNTGGHRTSALDKVREALNLNN